MFVLPGQYYDQETGLYQNGTRDYDPSTGRYLESDSIGLEGGLNTYAYVGDNPINEFDFLGMVAGNANTWTYGEIGSWAIISVRDLRPPAGLADAKASINAACSSNGNVQNCFAKDGSKLTNPIDKAAWNNIINAVGGTDKSGGGKYFCVDQPNCQHTYTCRDGQKVEIPNTMAPSGTVSVGTHTLYFYNDPLDGWDTPNNKNTACKCPTQ